MFETITLWDVRTDSVRAEPLGNGQFRVTLDVTAAKMRADTIGVETPVGMNDLVEIGVFAAGEDDRAQQTMYLRRHRIRSGTQRIVVTVPEVPVRAGIDPRNWLIERDEASNVVNVR